MLQNLLTINKTPDKSDHKEIPETNNKHCEKSWKIKNILAFFDNNVFCITCFLAWSRRHRQILE